MARPVKHGEATRDALLDAAELLLAGGADAVSVREVAEHVGVSTRAVYTAFGSMPGLMGALSARGFDRLTHLVQQTPVTDDPLADLATVGRAFRQFAIERPHLFRITFDRVSPGIYTQPEAGPALQHAYQTLEAFVDRALASGHLRPRPPAEIVFMFHSICCGLASNELSMAPPPVGATFWSMIADTDIASLWDTALTAFVDGLRTD